MRFQEYQEAAAETAIYPKDSAYPFLGLCGEAGEVAEKMKKIIRDKNGKVDKDDRLALKKELGDVLWYISAICTDHGISLEDVAESNIVKLKSRQKRGKIQGSGDDR